jgi:hypothetical protein
MPGWHDVLRRNVGTPPAHLNVDDNSIWLVRSSPAIVTRGKCWNISAAASGSFAMFASAADTNKARRIQREASVAQKRVAYWMQHSTTRTSQHSATPQHTAAQRSTPR